jgi:hypothetical protein
MKLKLILAGEFLRDRPRATGMLETRLLVSASMDLWR